LPSAQFNVLERLLTCKGSRQQLLLMILPLPLHATFQLLRGVLLTVLLCRQACYLASLQTSRLLQLMLAMQSAAAAAAAARLLRVRRCWLWC
jgi:hypothetical protein